MIDWDDKARASQAALPMAPTCAMPPRPDLLVYRIEWPNVLCPIVERAIPPQPNTNVIRVLVQNQSGMAVERAFNIKVVTRFKPQSGSGETREYIKRPALAPSRRPLHDGHDRVTSNFTPYVNSEES